ncbi:MAG: DUF1385 domain-containing protein, partial [Parasporobacterium sp.]|nr:DUF1385 domain-containing protein [Parasporobacterium sp.]
MKSSGIGGQAVMEGIMMRNGDEYAVAVRKSDGNIVVDKKTYKGITKKNKFFSLPFIRGTFSMIDSLVLGMRSLTFSADQFADEEETEEPSRIEKWLEDKFGDKLQKTIMDITMVIAVVFALLIFMVLPAVISNFMKRFLGNGFWLALFEG